MGDPTIDELVADVIVLRHRLVRQDRYIVKLEELARLQRERIDQLEVRPESRVEMPGRKIRVDPKWEGKMCVVCHVRPARTAGGACGRSCACKARNAIRFKQIREGRTMMNGVKAIVGSFLILACVMAFGDAIAQTTLPTLDQNCSLLWDPYIQSPDPLSQATQFKLYAQKDGVQQPAKMISLTQTSITCKAAGITANGSWVFNLHAVAADGTESDPSNQAAFILKINTKPANPQNLRPK